MRTADFDFALPSELIAQKPAPRRDESRLLVLHRDSGTIEHRNFREFLNYLRCGDVLVLNSSRVIPARLRGINSQTGGHFEILLLKENAVNDWWAMVRPGKRARIGTRIDVQRPKSKVQSPNSQPSGAISAIVVEKNEEGHRRLQFGGLSNIADALDDLGEVPLPHYIHRDAVLPEDKERYQTVYAEHAGSIAAPTAGLHFTESLLQEIRGRGVEICFVTLHVGPGTFLPVKTQTLTEHHMHEERYGLSAETARVVNDAKAAARRIIAVGTTTVRVLESVAVKNQGRLVPGDGRTNIFIHPPREFKIVDALLTNFHLPCSTLLMLVSAFSAPNETRGREMILSAYAEAVHERYRFFSYGDAMLIL